MATQIHGAGPTGQRSPGLDLAIAGYLAENPPAGGGGASTNYYALPASSGAITLSPANGDRQGVTLTGPATFTFEGDGQFALALNRSTSGYAASFEGVTWETPPNIAAGTNVLSFVKFGSQWFGFCSGIGFDTEPPTTPTNLAQGATTPSSVAVTWTASTDNVAIDGYEVSLNGGPWVDVFKVTSYLLAGLTTGTHQVRVRARDIKFNYSPPATITVATSAGGDTTAPVAGTLAASAIEQTSFTLTVTGASDAVALHATPYAFSTDNGATWSAWQSSAVFNATGMSAGTAYQGRHKVQDAAGNVTVGTAISVTTTSVTFDPSSISGLTLWLKSESLSGLTDGASITSWTDSSGLGNHAVPGGGAIPAPTKSSGNGHPAATFVNATGSVLTSPANALTPEGTIFVAVRRTAGASVRLVGSNLQGFRVGIGGTSQWNATVQTTGGTFDSISSTPNNTSPGNAWGVVGARYSDSADTLSVQFNSAALQSVTATKQITGTGTTTLIGNASISAAVDPFGGEIAEVLRYNVALTDEQMGQVLGYLRAKYGIA